jgi:hypothetical protein
VAVHTGVDMRKIVCFLLLASAVSVFGYGSPATVNISWHKAIGCGGGNLATDSAAVRLYAIAHKNALPGTYTITQYLNGSPVAGAISFVVAANGTVTPTSGVFSTGYDATNTPGTVQLKVTAAPANSGWKVGDLVDGAISLALGTPKCDGCGGGACLTGTIVPRYFVLGETLHSLTAHGQLYADCPETHTLALFVNGSSVASATTSTGGPSTVFADFSDYVTDRTGQSYAWKVDGATVSSGTITYDCGETGCSVSYSFGATATCTGTPTPTPTPTATPPYVTPTPTPSPGPTPGPPPGNDGTQPPNIGVNGGGVASDVIVDNPDDFYNPVKKAVEDAGAGHAGHAAFPVMPAAEADLSDDGDIDGLKDEIDNAGQNLEDTATDFSTRFDDFKEAWNTLPDSLGSVSSLHIGLGGLFPGAPDDLDLTDWLGAIGVWRSICLWLLTIAFGILTIRAFTYQN